MSALILEYEVGPLEHAALRAFLELKNSSTLSWPDYRTYVWGIVVLLLAMFTAYKAELPALLAGFAAILLWNVYSMLTLARRYKKTLEKNLSKIPTRRVRLEISEDGIREFTSDVECFAPWRAVKGFAKYQETLFIELADGKSALVPSKSLSDESSSIEDVIAVLKKIGIRENGTAR
jgi:hypothetical protein